MAKRELITREDAIKTVSRWIKTDMTLGSSLFEMMMNEIHAIPEQEIVKPYLEKLKEQIRYDYNRNIWGQYEYEKVMYCINNLLSEQEVKE